MPKIRDIQNSFTSGEISPRMLARTDLAAYQEAVKTMTNGISLTHGGVRRRPGSVYITSNKNAGRPTRLMPYVFTRNVSFVLIFNDGVIRFIREGAPVLDGVGPAVFELPHPYADGDLDGLTYAQNGSILIIAHDNYPPREIQLGMGGDDDWTTGEIDFTYNSIADLLYESSYVSFTLLSIGTGFVSGSVITFTTDGSGNVVGTPDVSGVPNPPANPPGAGTITLPVITAVLDPAGGQVWTLTCIIAQTNRQVFSVVGSITGEAIAQWHPGNFPKAVSFFEQRLYFGGSITDPQRIWGSGIGAYDSFTLGANDSDAVQLTMASNRFSQVLQLDAARTLLPFAFASEFSINGTSNGGIVPSGVNVREQSFYGTADIKPIRIGAEVLFVQRDRRKVRAVAYDISIDSNVAPDISLLAEHITGTGITDMVYQQDPDNTAWLIREDGVMLSLTHLRVQNITAWATHETDGLYKVLVSIPENETDAVYAVVERVVDGNTVQYIEQFSENSFTDSGFLGDNTGTPTTLWNGLDHLEGKTVAVRADGRVHSEQVVVGGAITLSFAAEVVEIGLGYTTLIEMLHPDIPLSDGSSQGSLTSISEIVLRLQDTVGVRVNGVEHAVFSFGTSTDTAPELFTGDLTFGNFGWNRDVNIRIEQTLPSPFTLLGVVSKVIVNDP